MQLPNGHVTLDNDGCWSRSILWKVQELERKPSLKECSIEPYLTSWKIFNDYLIGQNILNILIFEEVCKRWYFALANRKDEQVLSLDDPVNPKFANSKFDKLWSIWGQRLTVSQPVSKNVYRTDRVDMLAIK